MSTREKEPTSGWAATPSDVRRALSGDQRRPWESGPSGKVPSSSWDSFDDDTLLAWMQALPADHNRDEQLLEIVQSDRHFYVRQSAALRVTDTERLKAFAEDRHVGQILARRLSRAEDVTYLATLVREARFLEVRHAAQAQLDELRRRLNLSSIQACPPYR